jgi:hypothetical protein
MVELKVQKSSVDLINLGFVVKPGTTGYYVMPMYTLTLKLTGGRRMRISIEKLYSARKTCPHPILFSPFQVLDPILNFEGHNTQYIRFSTRERSGNEYI